MDDDSKVNLFLVYFVALTGFLFLKTDMVGQYLTTAPFPMALLIYLVTNPAYLLVIVGLITWKRDRIMRAFLSGVILVLAMDIVSPPRLGAAIPTATEISTSTNIDYIVWQAASHVINYPMFRIIYYVVVPILLIYLSVRLLGTKLFWQKVSGQ